MRILVKGRTKEICEREVATKENEGWTKVIEPKPDPDWIGGRYICVMSMPDDAEKQAKYRGKHKTFMGHY